jgi:cob(I)alamin adenosyltransferase
MFVPKVLKVCQAVNRNVAASVDKLQMRRPLNAQLHMARALERRIEFGAVQPPQVDAQ